MARLLYNEAGEVVGQYVMVGGQEYLQPPDRSPIPDVAAKMESHEQSARSAIVNCKATTAVALVSAGMSQAEADSAGTALIIQHAALLGAYELAGGNSAAKAALMAAILAAPPDWWSEPIQAIFEATL